MPKFTKENAILDDGIFLPKFLFYPNDSRQISASPTDSFNPAAFAEGSNGFESSTSPSKTQKKKALIIDQNSLAFYPDYGDRVALLARLKIAGFEIFLRSKATSENPNIFYKIGKDLENIEQLYNLSEFDKSLDSAELVKQNVASSAAVFLDQEQVKNIKQAFGRNGYAGEFFGDDLRCEFHAPVENKIELFEGFKTFDLVKSSLRKTRSMLFEQDLGMIDVLLSKQSSGELPPYLPYENPESLMEYIGRLETQGYSIEPHIDHGREAELYALRPALKEFIDERIFSKSDKEKIFEKKLFNPSDSDLEDLHKCINFAENFPEERLLLGKKLRALITSYTFDDSIYGEWDKLEMTILANIYEGREFSDHEKRAEFAKFLPTKVGKNLQPWISFAKAEYQVGSSNFYETELLKRIEEKRTSEEGSFRDYAQVLRSNLSPRVLERAFDLLIEDPKSKISYSDLFIVIKAFPERAGDLMDRFLDKVGDANKGFDLSSEIKNLPAEIANFISATHPEIANYKVDSDSAQYLDDENAKPKQTHLTIFGSSKSKDLAGSIKCIVAGGDYDNIAVIKLAGIVDKEDALYLCEIMGNFNSLKHVILPIEFQDDVEIKNALSRHENISYQFADHKKYLRMDELLEKKQQQTAAKEKNLSQEFGQGRVKEPTNKIRISRNKLKEDSLNDTKGDELTFNNVTAGEVLNNNSDSLLIRTFVLEQDLTKSIKQTEYVPTEFVEIADLHPLDQLEINELKTKDSTKEIYCKFQQSLKANQRFRLLSVDAGETLLGLAGDNIDGITIEKGDDDFLYATSASDRILEYVVKAPNPKLDFASYDQLPSNNPIKQIIDEYRDPSKGYTKVSAPENRDVGDYEESKRAEWLEEIFQKRSGGCCHRVAAVEYKLKTSGKIRGEDVRSVDINNNHVVLEIRCDQKWIKVDLGGRPINQVNLEEEEIYTPLAILEKEESAQKATTSSKASRLNSHSSAQTNLENDSDDDGEILPEADFQSHAPSETSAKTLELNFEETELRNLLKDLPPIASALLSTSKFKKITDQKLLKNEVFKGEHRNTLVVTPEIELHSNFFLEQARNSGRPSFYIDNPRKIDLCRTNLLIANDNSPTLTSEGLLSDFLKNSAQHPNQKPLLVINWDNFSDKEKVALNTVLDANRRINGEAIDESIQIIGLSKNPSQDPSFLSRHNLLIKSETDLFRLDSKNPAAAQAIDLEGLPNWRRAFFGKVVLVGDKMEWQKSEFVLALEGGKNNFEITNLSQEAAKKLQYEFSQARAVGEFSYHGYKIPCPPSLTITCLKKAFDFNKFNDESKISTAANITYDQSRTNSALINTYLFDALLCDKEINDGRYEEKPGLIEKCATTKDKTLKLFISSDLSDSQWYCLFNEAQKHEIKLELQIASGIKVPSDAKTTEIKIEEEAKISERKIKAQIFVSNDPEKTLKKIKKPQRIFDGSESKETETIDLFAIVDVEDCGYQDLIERITFNSTKTGFENFQKQESSFLASLKEGKKIVLKGEFSPDLLQMLEPILVSEVAKNLILIIEDKICEDRAAYEPLKWLSPHDYAVENHQEYYKANYTDRVFVETAELGCNLENSKTNSDAFIKERKDIFSETLANPSNSMLRLIGHSGVGKSRLLREFEANDRDTHSIHRGLDNLKSWAEDKTTAADGRSKTKILFIDESNIEDRHFTTFSPLKNGGAQKIFYQGNFYDLDESHKVVFACNPVEYGGGRFEQKLFEDGKVPAMTLRDFPAAYIYEKILKESIYDQLAPDIKSHLPERSFKENCKILIQEYQDSNSKKKSDEAGDETVRELQERTLQFIETSIFAKKTSDVRTPDFISTAATKEAENALDLSLSIRQKQHRGDLPNHACGLNGVLLEGDSGVGKSVLISAVLANRDLEEKRLGEESEDVDDKQRYYKIDANLPLAQKRQIITKAFEEGNIIWIDEINSCIDDGLEKILNAALTGEHPDGKADKEIKPGFMLISSVNSASLEGRSLISPALRHRTTQPCVKSLREYSQEDLATIVEHWVSQENEKNPNFVSSEMVKEVSAKIAEDFVTCLHSKGGENLNLRTLKKELAEIVKISQETSLQEPQQLKKKPSTTVDAEKAVTKLKNRNINNSK